MIITSSFECTTFDAGRDDDGYDQEIAFLAADMTVLCYSTEGGQKTTAPEYEQIKLLAVLMMLILPIGCPLLVFVDMFIKRARIESRQTQTAKGEEDAELHIGHLAVWVREQGHTTTRELR